MIHKNIVPVVLREHQLHHHHNHSNHHDGDHSLYSLVDHNSNNNNRKSIQKQPDDAFQEIFIQPSSSRKHRLFFVSQAMESRENIMVTSSDKKNVVPSAVSESTSNKNVEKEEKHNEQTHTAKEHDRPTLHRGDDDGSSSPSTRLLSTLKNAFHHLHIPHHHHHHSTATGHDEVQLKRFVQRHKWEQVLQWLNDEEKEQVNKMKKKQEMKKKEQRVTETTSGNDTITREKEEDKIEEEVTNVQKDDALHVMCRHHPPVSITKKTIQLMPHLMKQLNITNETPLHIAASHGASPQVIHLLVINYPEACSIQDLNGRTPLHGHLYECNPTRHICDTGESYKAQEQNHVDRNVVNHDTTNTNHHWLVTEGPGVMPAVKTLANEMSSKAAEENGHSSQQLSHNDNAPQHSSSSSSTTGSKKNNNDNKHLHMESRMLPVVQQYSKQLDHTHNLHHSPLVQGPLLYVVKDLCHNMSPQDLQLKDSQSGYTPYEVAKKMNCNETIRNVIREAM